MLDEGVVAAPEDIDLCMILGAGWPFHLGSMTPYLDRSGISAKVEWSRVPAGSRTGAGASPKPGTATARARCEHRSHRARAASFPARSPGSGLW